MRHRAIRHTLAALLLASALPAPAVAQDGNAPMSPAFLKAMEPMVPREQATARVITTPHGIRVNGRTLRYQAIVTEQPMPGADGAPVAVAVTYAYVLEGAAQAASRPVVFVFNGGPGASSLPLHIKAFGPRRLVGEGTAARFIDNPQTLLDVADLVFVDPVGTGASMPVKGADASSYWGVTGDARGINAIVDAWLKANGRTGSPRIFMGESYGTTRALAMVRELRKDQAPLPNGVVLLSLAIGDTASPVVRDVVRLPTLAAVAWYHGAIDRGGRTVQQHYDEALAFAQDEYATALFRGPALPETERRAVAERLSRLIGLEEETLLKLDLKPDNYDFMLNLLADQGLRTGQLDGRAKRGIEQSRLRPPFDDPSMSMGTESGTGIGEYLARELKYTLPSPYRSLNLGINFKWNYGGRFDDIALAPALREAMDTDKDLRVFAGGGLYDITTPVYAGQFALEQAGVPADRLTLKRYEAGHSVFEDDAGLTAMSADLHAFVAKLMADKSP